MPTTEPPGRGSPVLAHQRLRHHPFQLALTEAAVGRAREAGTRPSCVGARRRSCGMGKHGVVPRERTDESRLWSGGWTP